MVGWIERIISWVVAPGVVGYFLWRLEENQKYSRSFDERLRAIECKYQTQQDVSAAVQPLQEDIRRLEQFKGVGIEEFKVLLEPIRDELVRLEGHALMQREFDSFQKELSARLDSVDRKLDQLFAPKT